MYNFDSLTTENGLLIKTFILKQNKYAYLKKIFPNSGIFLSKYITKWGCLFLYKYITGVENQSVLKSKKLIS